MIIILKINYGISIESDSGLLAFKSILTDIDYNGLIFSSILLILSVSLFMISVSLFEVINAINKDIIYYIIRKENVDSCELYLEYDEYFMIIDNEGTERYIKKSEIIEIDKSRQRFNYKDKENKKIRK